LASPRRASSTSFFASSISFLYASRTAGMFT
jgi:hypothetical protein